VSYSIKTLAISQAHKNGVELCGDIDLLGRHIDIPVVAITGSNGKSTVTTLVGEVLKAAGKKPFVGGNIGLPALSVFDESQAYDVAVLELSSFQLETTEHLKLVSSVNLNVSPDHMDRYASYEEYASSKAKIHSQSKYCVINVDDELTQLGVPAETVCSNFSLSSDADYTVLDSNIVKNDQPLMPVADIKMIGAHNVANVLATLALLEPFNIDFSVFKQVLTTFPGLAHRTQVVRELDEVNWVNDSKATNVGACQAAIEGIDSDIILIAGGVGKDGDFASLVSALKGKVTTALLLGEDAAEMKQLWSSACTCELVEDMAQAVSRAKELAKKGDTVLLSPACASFDMYKGFAARGDHFIELVEALL